MIRTKNRSSHPQDPALERGIDHPEAIVAEEEEEVEKPKKPAAKVSRISIYPSGLLLIVFSTQPRAKVSANC